MKKLVLTLLVVALAIPAMAADVTIDSSGLIQITTVAGENLRGLAVVVESENDITAVTPGGPFNVFMDAAYEAETATPGSYNVGDGGPVANPDAKGTLALPAKRISLCMGYVDQGATQAAVAAGTTDVATIATTGLVTVKLDVLRGGIVGDAVTPDPDGEILASETIGGLCKGDVAGAFGAPGTNGSVDVFDLTAVVGYISQSTDLAFYSMPAEGQWVAADVVGDFGAPGTNGKVDVFDLTAIVGHLSQSTDLAFYTMPCMP